MGDEAASILSAQRSFASLISLSQHVDAVHSLYYAGLHLWIGLAGASPFAVRFPSAVAIGVTAALLVVLGRRLRGLRFGIIAGLAAAVLPRLTDVGSEARSYATTAAVAVVLTLILVLQLQATAPRRRLWAAYAIVLAFGTLLFLWVALVAGAHLIALALARRELVRSWLVSFGAAMVAASPVLVFAVGERNQIAYLAERQKYDITALFVTPWFENPTTALVAWPLVGAGVALGVREWIVGRRRGEVRDGRWRVALIPALWTLIPSLILIGGSSVISVYTPRYLAMCAPAVALLIATPVDALLASGRRRVNTVALVAIVALIGVIAPVWSAQRQPYAKNDSDWAVISADMAAHARPGDAVAFDDSTRPSRRPRLALRTYPAGFVGLKDVTLKTRWTDSLDWYDTTYTLAQAITIGRLRGVTRLWLVEYATPGHTDTNGVAAAQAAGFRKVSIIRTHRSAIMEFVRG